MTDNNFLGKGWAFPPSFSKGGKDVNMVSDEEDIMQSLEILFSTNFKERFYYTDFGCDLNRFMFQHVDQTLKNEVKYLVEDTLIRYETRIDVDKVEINQDSEELGKLLISLYFRVRATNSRFNMVYPFYVSESAENP